MKKSKKLLREQRRQKRWAKKQANEKAEKEKHEQELRDYDVKRNRFPEITHRESWIKLFSEPDCEFSIIPFVDLRTEKCSTCPFLKKEKFGIDEPIEQQFCSKGIHQIRWLPHKLVDIVKYHLELLEALTKMLESYDLQGCIALLDKSDEELKKLEKSEEFPGTTEEFFSLVEEEFIPSCELLKKLMAKKMSQEEMSDLLFSYA